MLYDRTISKTIISLISQYPVIMLTGPRQVGKTTTLRNLQTDIDYKYITLDNPLIRAEAKSDPELFIQRNKPPLIIDEIQYAEELLPYIKIFVDEMRINGENPNGLFLLTGSQMFQSMKNISESLAGRVAIINLIGLSASEIEQVEEKKFMPTFSHIEKNYKRYDTSVNEVFERIIRGSFPELYRNKNMDYGMYYSSYVQTYLEKDIRDVLKIKDEMKFIRFLSSVAVRSGQELVYEELAKDADIDLKTATSWLSVMITTGLVYLLKPYFNNQIKRIVKRPKIYLMDTGLACYLARYTDASTLEVSRYSGQIFETYVVTEILKTYINKGINANIYYLRDSNQKEIDILIIENNTIYPIEIKKSSNPGVSAIKHFNVLSKTKLKIGEGGVICMIPQIISIDKTNNYIPIQCI